jgi:hypothetical protein
VSVILLVGLIPLVCGAAKEPKQYKAPQQTKPPFGVAFLFSKNLCYTTCIKVTGGKMEYPKTRKEAKETGATHYYTGEPCSRGHVALRKTKGSCTECLKEDWTADNAKRSLKPKSEAAKKAGRKYYECNKELVKLKALGRSNEDRQRYRNAWKDRNPLEVKASTKHRRDKHKQATPKWLSLEQKAEIRKIYIDAMTVSRVTKTPYVVDHIIPLRGQDVCGLHVPWNLQIMSREENLKKSNKHLAET